MIGGRGEGPGGGDAHSCRQGETILQFGACSHPAKGFGKYMALALVDTTVQHVQVR